MSICERDPEVKRLFSELRNKNPKIMVDGILDNKKYDQAHPKIAWIIKQAVDLGIYDIRELLDNGNHTYMRSAVTWRHLSEVSAGLLDPAASFNQVDKMDVDTLYEAILHTAYINVVKETGGSTTSDDLVLRSYPMYRDLIKQQLKAYDPDIVIVCFTGKHERLKPVVQGISEDYLGKQLDFTSSKNIASGRTDATVFPNATHTKALLWTYHPAYRGMRDEDWFKTITDAAKYGLSMP